MGNQVEARIEMFLGNLAEFGGFAFACAGEQDVDLALFALDCIEQTVEVVEIRSSPRTPVSSGQSA